MSSNLFFEVEQVKVGTQREFNPVSRKIIDVRVFSGEELLYSSIAARYIQCAESNELVSERKQLRFDIQLAVRTVNQFPYPRRVNYAGSNDELYKFDQGLRCGAVQQLDVSESVDDQFVQEYVALADYLCERRAFAGGERPKPDELDQEEIAFYAISAQLPPVNEVGRAFRRFTKACGCSKAVAQFYGQTELKALTSAVTRRWEGEERYDLIRRVFGISKLLWHTGAIDSQSLSQIICCCCANNSMPFAEAAPFLFDSGGIFRWILAEKGLISPLALAGFPDKLVWAVDYAISDQCEMEIENAQLLGRLISSLLRCEAFAQKWRLRSCAPRVRRRLSLLDEDSFLKRPLEALLAALGCK